MNRTNETIPNYHVPQKQNKKVGETHSRPLCLLSFAPLLGTLFFREAGGVEYDQNSGVLVATLYVKIARRGTLEFN